MKRKHCEIFNLAKTRDMCDDMHISVLEFIWISKAFKSENKLMGWNELTSGSKLAIPLRIGRLSEQARSA